MRGTQKKGFPRDDRQQQPVPEVSLYAMPPLVVLARRQGVLARLPDAEGRRRESLNPRARLQKLKKVGNGQSSGGGNLRRPKKKIQWKHNQVEWYWQGNYPTHQPAYLHGDGEAITARPAPNWANFTSTVQDRR